MTTWLTGHHVSAATFGAFMSLAGLVSEAANQAQTQPYTWIIVLVSLTGLVSAVASLIAALANFMKARAERREEELEEHRRRKDRGRPW